MAEIGAMEVRIGANIEDLTKKLKESQKPFKELAEVIGSAGRAFTQTFTIPIAGAAAAVFAFSDKAKAAFSDFASKVKASLGSVGDDLAKTANLSGILDTIASAVKSVCDAFISLPDAVKKAIIALGFLLAAVGPVLLAFEKLLRLWGAMKFALGLLGAAGAGGGLVAGVLALVGGLTLLGTSAETATNSLVKLNDETKEARAEYLRTQIQYYSDLIEKIKAAAIEEKKLYDHALPGPATKNMRPGELRSEFLKGAGPGAWDAAQVESAQRMLESYRAELEKITGAIHKITTESEVDWKAVDDAMKKVNDTMRQSEAETLVYGESTDRLKKEVDDLRQVLVDLVKAGIKPSDEAFQIVSGRIGYLSGQISAKKEELTGLNVFCDTIMARLAQIPPAAAQIANLIVDIYQSLAQGIGDAVAQIIVYGEKAGKVFSSLMKRIAAQVISTLVAIGVQYLIIKLLQLLGVIDLLAANMKQGAATTYANAFASTCAIPIIGPALAPAVAAGATATMLAGAALAGASGFGAGMGMAAAAEGGIFTTPGITRIAERGRAEFVLNRENIRRYGPELGLGSLANLPPIHTHVYLDRRQIAEAITEELQFQGI